jgi:hypothetical protein
VPESVIKPAVHQNGFLGYGPIMKIILVAAAVATFVNQGGEELVIRGPRPRIDVGQCALTSVEKFLQVSDLLTTAHAIFYQNGLTQYALTDKDPFRKAKTGDAVKVCLVAVPQDCPRGDDRGKTYRATDLRTNRTWTLPDDMHRCGGA